MCPRPLDDGDAGLKIDRSGLTKTGGARRDRTADLLHAMQALSQLSYGPVTLNYCISKRKRLYFGKLSPKNATPSRQEVARISGTPSLVSTNYLLGDSAHNY